MMSNRYAEMSEAQLLVEMEAWQSVADADKSPNSPSNDVRDAAKTQWFLAEAWYHRHRLSSQAELEGK